MIDHVSCGHASSAFGRSSNKEVELGSRLSNVDYCGMGLDAHRTCCTESKDATSVLSHLLIQHVLPC